MEKLKKIFEVTIPNVAALLVILSFLGLIFLLILRPIEINKSVEGVILITIGHLGSKFGSIIDYWFGSSSGSKAKTELMDKINTPIASNPV